MSSRGYHPRKRQGVILDTAWSHVQSVPYRVTLRWLFYRLLQDGIYTKKEEYDRNFKPLVAEARIRFYKKWTPDTLADDTREATIRGRGFDDEQDWLEAVGQAKCRIDKWQLQRFYVEVWFEARAMSGQFSHYTKHVTLGPFGGDPSIPYKWQIAKELEEAHGLYGKSIVILYFGDFDPKGLSIPEYAVRDIRSWCDVGFKFIRCALNEGDGEEYGLQENPDKPGSFQWEAVPDDVAESIITEWVDQYVDAEMFTMGEELETYITEQFQKQWEAFRSWRRK